MTDRETFLFAFLVLSALLVLAVLIVGGGAFALGWWLSRNRQMQFPVSKSVEPHGQGHGPGPARQPRAIPYDQERLAAMEREKRAELSSLSRDPSRLVRRLAEAHSGQMPMPTAPGNGKAA